VDGSGDLALAGTSLSGDQHSGKPGPHGAPAEGEHLVEDLPHRRAPPHQAAEVGARRVSPTQVLELGPEPGQLENPVNGKQELVPGDVGLQLGVCARPQRYPIDFIAGARDRHDPRGGIAQLQEPDDMLNLILGTRGHQHNTVGHLIDVGRPA
jgi:hypothetical protein